MSIDDVRLETARLLLRPLLPEDAAVVREMWPERDPRVPAHCRIDADGYPSIDELRARAVGPSANLLGPLAVVDRAGGGVVGTRGLVASDRTPSGEPEIAFELLQRAQGRGYATEAARTVLEWADTHGYPVVGATVWDWNAASLRVLTKLGFERTTINFPGGECGTTLLLLRQETIHRESLPGLAASIREARAEGIEAGSEELVW